MSNNLQVGIPSVATLGHSMYKLKITTTTTNTTNQPNNQTEKKPWMPQLIGGLLFGLVEHAKLMKIYFNQTFGVTEHNRVSSLATH